MECDCYLCSIAQKGTTRFKKKKAPDSKDENRCSKCLGIIKRGISHPCTLSSIVCNVEGLIQNKCSEGQSDQITSIIKKKKFMTIKRITQRCFLSNCVEKSSQSL